MITFWGLFFLYIFSPVGVALLASSSAVVGCRLKNVFGHRAMRGWRVVSPLRLYLRRLHKNQIHLFSFPQMRLVNVRSLACPFVHNHNDSRFFVFCCCHFDKRAERLGVVVYILVYSALTTSAPTASMSKALSLGNGRGMPRSSTTVLFSVFTTKHPLRGLTGLMTTGTPFFAPARNVLSFSARVLNAFQLLQACYLCIVG